MPGFMFKYFEKVIMTPQCFSDSGNGHKCWGQVESSVTRDLVNR